EDNIAKFDLTLNAMFSDEKLSFSIQYCSKLFNKETIERLSNHYLTILDSILTNNEINITEIELLSEKEKNQLLNGFNDTKAEYPMDKTIQELFEEQVEKTSNNIAVVFKEEKLTYRELNEKANSLARVLRDKGVKGDSIIGIMVERSLEMIIGIMGILKSGGAYLPIDPNYPKERIEYMLKDSKSKILLSKNVVIENIEFDGETIDLCNIDLYNKNSSNLEKINNSNDLAYVIYTSGTTDKPKGVMVEHNNVVRLMFNNKMIFKFDHKDVWTMFHSYCFDFSVWEMYGAILYGGKLIIVPELVTKDFEEYLSLLKREKVTILNQTPTAFYNLMNIETDNEEKHLNLKYIILGGEALNPQMLYKWKQKYNETKIINMYGITETTVHVTYKEIGDQEIAKGISNIGCPIPTLTTYVMNNNLKLQPIGVQGELCVGGDGVARGYLNRKELTEKKFVMNPYVKNERIYRSGDLVRLLENGELEFLGRIDNQVKIRGFRIELGEIESKILQHEDVKEVAVVVIDSNDKSICSYIVSYKELNELNLRDYLKESLPEYMIPAYFVKLERMPITPNGKLDRRALPKPNLDERLTSYEAPRNALEETLVRVWSEILGIQKIGINDNFFELGGHSLKAMTLISKIHKETNKEVPLKELFKSPTIKGLSKFIEEAEESIYSKIEKVEEREYYEASSAQKRMYIIQGFDKESMAYNMPQVFEIQGSMDKVKIEDAFKKLVQRHEALRTYFEVIDGEIVQKIDKSYEFKLDQEVSNQSIEEIANDFVKPFDLGKAPLFRVQIVETQSKNYLLIDMHHIISDGVSISILINEFATIYNGEELEPLKLQYKDFAAWQNNFLKSEEMKKQEEYWINMFKDEIPVLNMPTDYERPAVQSFEGDSVSFEVDKNVALELKELTKKTGTTVHMVLLSAFNILLSKHNGQEDIVIGTPIAGRPHADLQNIMGMFVNTLALRNKPEGDKKYVDFLNEVKENSLKAYDNQSYQLETLIEKLDIVRDTSRNPLFDIMFNMVDTVTGVDIDLNNMLLIPCDSENNVAKFDLTLNVMASDEKLSFTIQYCSKLFKKETIERLSNHYIKVLETIINNNEIELDSIDL
ncbi:non-ribosomal peptide synthetase, partial [Clostridium frigidicarnis]